MPMPATSTCNNSARTSRRMTSVLPAFSRVYQPGSGPYLNEIAIWAQRAKVDLVNWSIASRRIEGVDEFYATPTCELIRR